LPTEEEILERAHHYWEEWKRRRIGKKVFGMTYKEMEHLYRWFLKQCEKAGIDPEEIDFGSIVGAKETYDENKVALYKEIQKHLGRILTDEQAAREIEVEEATPKSLDELLEKLGLELPDVEDPYYYEKMEDVARQLAERLLEAEKTAGKVKVRVAGKERIWDSNKVYKFVEGLNYKIRLLESELEKAKKEARPLVKVRVLKDFKEAFMTYKKGQVLELREPSDIEWAKKKIKEGYLEEIPVIEVEKRPPPYYVVPPTKSLREVVKEAIEELEKL